MEGDRILKRITFKSTMIEPFGEKTFDGVHVKVDIIIPRAKMKNVKLIKLRSDAKNKLIIEKFCVIF